MALGALALIASILASGATAANQTRQAVSQPSKDQFSGASAHLQSGQQMKNRNELLMQALLSGQMGGMGQDPMQFFSQMQTPQIQPYQRMGGGNPYAGYFGLS